MYPVLGSDPFYIVFIHMESLQHSVDISIFATRKQVQSRGAASNSHAYSLSAFRIHIPQPHRPIGLYGYRPSSTPLKSNIFPGSRLSCVK